MNELTGIHQEIVGCDRCALAKTRTQAVPGEGPATAELLFIGEGPGFHEDKQGRPFVGQAGQLLTELLASIDLRREDVFITNIVKCRPPGNRDPLPDEIAACAGYLERQVATLRPKVVVTLGRHSLAKFLPGQTIGRVHGQPARVNGTLVFPMYHPAAALHNQSLRPVLFEDIQKLPGLVREARQAEVRAAAGTPEVKPQQLTMF